MQRKEFESLLCLITPNVVAKILENNDWSEDEALLRFTASKLYSMLEDEKTKVWQYSTTMLADLFEDERSGNLTFPEV